MELHLRVLVQRRHHLRPEGKVQLALGNAKDVQQRGRVLRVGQLQQSALPSVQFSVGVVSQHGFYIVSLRYQFRDAEVEVHVGVQRDKVKDHT